MTKEKQTETEVSEVKKKPKQSNEKNLSLRGRVFEGRVISDKMHKTVTVEWERRRFVPKYERYERRRTKVKAHNPENINAKTGDVVKIMETRPISKTKNFIVIEVLNQEKTQEKESKNEAN